MTPSVSADELRHYERMRLKFSGDDGDVRDDGDGHRGGGGGGYPTAAGGKGRGREGGGWGDATESNGRIVGGGF